MKKKMIFSFGVVAVIGMSMWALVFGVIGGSGRPMERRLPAKAEVLIQEKRNQQKFPPRPAGGFLFSRKAQRR